MDVPIWFQPQKFNSIAKWMIFFIERAIWIHYTTHVLNRRDLPLLEIQNIWIKPEHKLILFKNVILPYWTDLTQKIAKEPQVTI
jgi:hypothetical protein